MNKSLTITPAGLLLAGMVFLTIACASPAGTSAKQDNVPLGKILGSRAARGEVYNIGKPPPDFQFQMPDGETMLLSDPKGKVVLLNFWQVSCPWCVYEMPFLQTVHQKQAGNGLVILGINLGEPEKTVRNFVTSKNLTFPILLDPDHIASTMYDTRYLPTTYIINKAGNLQSYKIGAFQGVAEITAAIEALLRE